MSEKELSMDAKADRARISILLCKRHGYYAVSLDDDTCGHRITPTKCCGSWDTVRTFPLTKDSIDDTIKELRRLKKLCA